jgi:cytochrome P450
MTASTDVRTADDLLRELFEEPTAGLDPYPLYHRIREAAPFYRSEADETWYVSAFEAGRQVLNDPNCGRDLDRPNRSIAFRSRSVQAQTVGIFRSTLLMKNPPDHTRLRGVVSEAFTMRRLKALEARIAALTDERLDVIEEKGDADVMADLAFILPVSVIGELVGVPAEEREQFRQLVNMRFAGGERGNQVRQTLEGYFADLVERRRAEPADDLLTELVAARDREDRLSEEEVVAMVMIVFLAGFVTTTNLIGNGLIALLRSPDQLRRLRDEPGLTQLAVGEMLRYDPPVQVVGRTALRPTEVAGQPIPEGDTIVCLIGGANRDPERFPDPDRFDAGRKHGQPLSFGWGIHHCLGSVLASMEGRVVFERMLKRFASIELLEEEPPMQPGGFLRGRTRLPIRVRPA